MASEAFFTADDWGLNSDVNRAILRAHTHGALHGASLMMGQAGTREAIEMARDHPQLQVGWHLHLSDSKPVTCTAWRWGTSPSRAGWSIASSPAGRALVRREIAAQWELFQASGLPCAFVNSHHHLHAHPLVYREVIGALEGHFDGWLRLGAPRFFSNTPCHRVLASAAAVFTERRRRVCPFVASATLWGLDRLWRMQAREIATTSRALHEIEARIPPAHRKPKEDAGHRFHTPATPAALHEFLFHPRRIENDTDLACLVDLKSAAAIEAADSR